MDLIFLGTGAGKPSRERNVAGLALSFLPARNEWWLFDCGEATQHQVMKVGLSLHRLTRVYITHLHGDHIYGLPGLLTSRSAEGSTARLTLYGPEGLRRWIEETMLCSSTHLTYPLSIEEAPSPAEREEGTPEDWVVEAIGDVTVRAAWLNHVIPSLGYRLEQSDSPGNLLVDALREQRIPPGPVYGRLKRGETVRLEDGRIIHGAGFIGPPKRGITLCILGDTSPTQSAQRLAQRADVVVHEATFDASLEENANRFGHSTAPQAAAAAERANAKSLVLTHISSRYQGATAHDLLESARSIFPQTFLASDGARFVLGTHGVSPIR